MAIYQWVAPGEFSVSSVQFSVLNTAERERFGFFVFYRSLSFLTVPMPSLAGSRRPVNTAQKRVLASVTLAAISLH